MTISISLLLSIFNQAITITLIFTQPITITLDLQSAYYYYSKFPVSLLLLLQMVGNHSKNKHIILQIFRISVHKVYGMMLNGLTSCSVVLKNVRL